MDERPIRFECQGSGNCCHGGQGYGYVYLTDSDLDRLSAHFKLPLKTFIRKFTEKTDGHVHLKGPERDCRFLENRACTIYGARPGQCRTWPFWPENMDPQVWKSEVAPRCPGIGNGRVYPPEEIDIILTKGRTVPGKR